MCEKPAEVKEDKPTEFSFPRISLSLSDGEYHLAAKAGMTISSYHEKSSSQLQSKPEKDCDIKLGTKEDIIGISITDESTNTGYKITKVEEDDTVIAEVDIYLDLPVSVNISGHEISISEERKIYTISIDGDTQTIPMSEIKWKKGFKVDEKTSFTVEESVHLTQIDQVLTI